jgi:hypothetical protein
MKRLSLLLLFAPILLSLACDSPTPPDPASMRDQDVAAPLLRSENAKSIERWFSDYYTPLVPAAFGHRTLQVTAGEPLGKIATSYLGDTYTIPYTSGARTGTLLVFESDWDTEMQLLHVDDKRLYILNEGSYYLSTDCEPTQFPPWLVFGRISDGMILDQTAPPGEKVWRVHYQTGACEEGTERAWSYLIQIRDVNVGGKRYSKALLAWILVEGEFHELDFNGKAEDLGIQLPTSDDTQGKAIAGLGIYGFHRGLLGGGEIDYSSGTLVRLVELVSIDRP